MACRLQIDYCVTVSDLSGGGAFHMSHYAFAFISSIRKLPSGTVRGIWQHFGASLQPIERRFAHTQILYIPYTYTQTHTQRHIYRHADT